MHYDIVKAKAEGWSVVTVADEDSGPRQKIEHDPSVTPFKEAVLCARAAGLDVTDDGFVLRQTARQAFDRLWSFCAAMGTTQGIQMNYLLRDLGEAVAKRHCLLVVTGDTEPTVFEGYEDEEARDAAAVQYNHDHGDSDGLFMLDVCGDVEINAYSADFFVDEYERRDNES